MYLGKSWVHFFLMVKAIKAQKVPGTYIQPGTYSQLIDAITLSVAFCHSSLAEMKERTKGILFFVMHTTCKCMASPRGPIGHQKEPWLGHIKVKWQRRKRAKTARSSGAGGLSLEINTKIKQYQTKINPQKLNRLFRCVDRRCRPKALEAGSSCGGCLQYYGCYLFVLLPLGVGPRPEPVHQYDVGCWNRNLSNLNC